jgi:hypothetical protein
MATLNQVLMILMVPYGFISLWRSTTQLVMYDFIWLCPCGTELSAKHVAGCVCEMGSCRSGTEVGATPLRM